jgi:hypothetical protein
VLTFNCLQHQLGHVAAQTPTTVESIKPLTEWNTHIQRWYAIAMGYQIGETRSLPQEFTQRAQHQLLAGIAEGGASIDFAAINPGLYLDRRLRIYANIDQIQIKDARESMERLHHDFDSPHMRDTALALATVRARLASAPGPLAKVPNTIQELLARWGDRDNPNSPPKIRPLLEWGAKLRQHLLIRVDAKGNRDTLNNLLLQNQSFGQPGASDIVTTVPTGPSMVFTDSEFGAFWSLRLGMNAPRGVPADMAQHKCICAQGDVCVDHSMMCKRLGGDVVNHNAMRDYLIYLLRSNLGVTVVREPRHIGDDPDKGVDASVWLNNILAMVDWTKVSLWRKGRPNHDKTTPLAAAKAAEERKAKYYKGMYETNSMRLFTAAMEVPTLAIGKQFQALLSLVQSHADNNGIQAAFMVPNFQMRTISISIRRRMVFQAARQMVMGVQQMVKKNARKTGYPLRY